MYKKSFLLIALSLLATQSAVEANCCLGREQDSKTKKWSPLKETTACKGLQENLCDQKSGCYWTACPRATPDLSIEEKNKQAIRSKIREKMNATDTDSLKANSDIENQENSKTRPMLGQARKKAKELKKTNQQPVN
jgi:hypothetical protein